MSDPDDGLMASEFALVRVTVDRSANGPRLKVEDLENGRTVYLEPLELSSFCAATDDDRAAWLRVGAYRRGAAPAIDEP
ncbi:hypothetical protein [Micromonospora radicis]|uniref:Uncharacterized protein n=1 Tax=Micromonospora radicis TaxID=1894971 RepID=A0A418MXF4_9ACTN|nr:hypothetical protein [Micromonospora radicis]RIV39214.1 hypothetical protein D2L64_10210 [Micromonospora radicis]